MGPREECSLHPVVKPCELHPDHLGGGNVKTRAVVRGASPSAAVPNKGALTSSVLKLQPDHVQCMVCHKCGLCCAARKHEASKIRAHMLKSITT